MRASDVTELLLLAALWGGSFLFMRIAAPVLGPVWLIEMRVLLAGLALLLILLLLNLWSEVRRRVIPLFVVGCINSALPFSFLAFAKEKIFGSLVAKGFAPNVVEVAGVLTHFKAQLGRIGWTFNGVSS
ncbi:MAG: EamA family transporter [Leptolyngbyaceae cyanobacterium SU_3_3]|nr:EamA family transporter [Leptolyngbyaceae cyanobacterium SU_3_3]